MKTSNIVLKNSFFLKNCLKLPWNFLIKSNKVCSENYKKEDVEWRGGVGGGRGGGLKGRR